MQWDRNGYKIIVPDEIGVQKGEMYLFERVDENTIKMTKIA